VCSLYYPLVVSVLEKRGLFILYRFINGFVFRNQVVGARRWPGGGARAARRGVGRARGAGGRAAAHARRAVSRASRRGRGRLEVALDGAGRGACPLGRLGLGTRARRRGGARRQRRPASAACMGPWRMGHGGACAFNRGERARPRARICKKSRCRRRLHNPLTSYTSGRPSTRHRESVRKGGWYERDIEANRRVRC